MAKRFVNPDWKILRKLSSNLQRAYFYCWDKADACGMYEHDPAYMKADLGVVISISELAKLPNVKVYEGGKIFFSDFIETNYGTLKEGYNPHKPVFRALEKNKISSLSEACPKLEDEDEEEEEDKGEEEGEDKGQQPQKFENPFGEKFTEWQGWKDYKQEEHREKYRSPKTEQAAANKLFKLANGDPETARLIIQQSIENRWKGLFELKNNYGTTKAKTGFTRTGIQEALNRRINEIRQDRA